MDVPYSTLGLRLANSFVVGVGVLTPHATLAWRHAYDDVRQAIAGEVYRGDTCLENITQTDAI